MTRALLRHLLEVRRDALRRRLGLAELVESPGPWSGAGHTHDAADAGAERAASIESYASRELVARQLHEVEAALERMRAGTFGACVDCNAPIAPRRLEAVPWVARCLGCQEAVEQAIPLHVRIAGEAWPQSEDDEERA